MPKKITPFVALITCFNPDESINQTAVLKQVRRQVDAGNNILFCGTNGDFTSMTFSEKVDLCAAVVSEVKGKALVFANAGCPSTYETLLLGKEFIKAGVEAIAVITPYFIDCTQEGLYAHYCRLADSLEKPVYMYDIPPRTQNHIEPETAARLATHPNIKGMKDSGGVKETLDVFLDIGRDNPGFDVFVGPDLLIHYALSRGASGCISGLGNIAPRLVNSICTAHAEGDMAAAEAAQTKLAELRKRLFALGYAPAVTKRALYLSDPTVGASRSPALQADAALDSKIAEILCDLDIAAA
ncbi:dihydrodipicolinate synthase family protein [Betaproteobacteria bacterium]|nr:dihydrodipicolinate synthase family protein [Betaproteobacteria bacterium]